MAVYFGGWPNRLRSRGSGRGGPVIQKLGASNAIHPPGETGFCEDLPLVQGIAPALAGGGEVVGWDAGDADGREVRVELKELGVGPDVGRIVIDKDGDVADETNVACGTILAQGTPLFVKGELEGLDGREFFSVLPAETIEGGGSPC